MHKITKTALALVAGTALALGVPLAASATPVATASVVSVNSAAAPVALSHTGNDQGKDHGTGWGKPIPKPHPTKPAYPPTRPPKPPHHHPKPFWWGGFWWFPFFFPAHTFHPGSIIHIVFTGFGGFSFFGTFTADESGSIGLGTAAADGSLTAQLKASGSADLAGQTLNATATDSAGTAVTQSVTVPAEAPAAPAAAPNAGAAAPASSSATTVDPDTLAQSGTYISLATVWAAVGLLALGTGFVFMRSVTRRKDRAKA
ncbi:hypothetical protein [Gryllotalpicola protaetiae]|uniref:LPXTG cell wall anchor domain-containing protein n=1 Tax=Gryllotalpicola protaetiae TaxID=2419771 RepID=A0A387C0X5_9MICO|nr:hypothetical protein [Gryllotalpicola protaetiae]AYG04181.1 hypothetical protein D7I44_11995 [Gryllotalpicola protaetiae]